MSIAKFSIKIKGIERLLILGVGVATVIAVFGYVRLSVLLNAHKSPTIAHSLMYQPFVHMSPINPPFVLVASQKGTKYYASTCSAAKRIRPENLISFKNREEAEAKQYTPAANCPDLKEDF